MDTIVNPDLIISYAYTLAALGRHLESADAYKEYLATAPTGEYAGIALRNSATALRKLNDDAEAEKKLRQAIATEPTDSSHYTNLIQNPSRSKEVCRGRTFD